MSLRPEDLVPPIRTARSRDFYLAYLNSSSWRARRNRALQLSEYRCNRCTSKRDLQVHHKTYERLGGEWDEDLEVVCANCHEGEHVQQIAGSDDAIYLKLTREAVRNDFSGSVSSLAEDVKTLCAKRKIPYDSGRLTRALELVVGARLTRTQTPRVDGTEPAPGELNRQEAHELLCRLGVFDMMDRLAKVMPSADKPADEQRAHEDKIRRQIREMRGQDYRSERNRQPLRERLEAIFVKP